jgi:hypothetical protein
LAEVNQVPNTTAILELPEPHCIVFPFGKRRPWYRRSCNRFVELEIELVLETLNKDRLENLHEVLLLVVLNLAADVFLHLALIIAIDDLLELSLRLERLRLDVAPWWVTESRCQQSSCDLSTHAGQAVSRATSTFE